MNTKKKILIVEDEILIAIDIKRILEEEDYNVLDIIGSGKEAIDKAIELKPDLILMDILLNDDVSGIDAASVIQYHHIPVIYISSLNYQQISKELIESGSYGYIVKPFNKDELITKIEIVLSRHNLYSKLQESEEKFRSLFANMINGLAFHKIVTDDDGEAVDYIFLAINDAFEELTGLKRDDVIGKRITEVLPGIENDPTGWIEKYGEVALTGKSTRFESYSELLKKWFSINAYCPQKGYFATIFDDITERILTENKIAESRNLYKSLVETSIDGIVLTDLDGKCIYCNQRQADLLGYNNCDELIGADGFKFIAPEHKDRVAKTFLRLNTEKFIEGVVYDIIKKDGTRLIAEFSVQTIFNEEKCPQRFMVLMRDITERKRIEDALAKSHEELRNLTIYNDAKMEEERKKIAREIHDGLGQLLTGLKLNLSLFSKNYSSNQKTSEKLDDMKKIIDSGIDLVRDISKELRPVVLDDLGIIAVMQMRLNDFESDTGIKSEFFCNSEDIVLDADLGLSIYRIFLEILTNIIRHANAQKVSVKFQKQKSQIVLEVTDDGAGISEEQISSSLSFGLIGIGERLNTWHGAMKIEGIPGKGTTIIIKIPI